MNKQKGDVPDRLLTVLEIAAHLSISEGTIYFWVARNEIPFLRVGRHLRFSLPEVLRFYQNRTQDLRRSCFGIIEPVDRPGSCSLKTKKVSRADPQKKGGEYGNS